VSIVAAACLRLSQAARWNGHAPHVTTGAARVRDSHCQLSNCSDGIMASATTGMASNADAVIRCRSARVSSGSAASPEAAVSTGVDQVGAGVAVYPTDSTWATSLSASIPGGTRTFARSVA